jgi:hypothetical protein
MDHKLVIVEKPVNFAQYRWETTCSCGWQGRGPTQAVAESLGTSHGGTLPKKEDKPKMVATTGGIVGTGTKPPAPPVVPPKPVVPVAKPAPATPATPAMFTKPVAKP